MKQNPNNIYNGDYHGRLSTGFIGGTEEGAGIKGMTFSGETLNSVDNDIDNYLNPFFEAEVRGALQEVEQMRYAGKLMPFREGQHIGMLPRWVCIRTLTPKQLTKAHNMRMEGQRTEMLRLRANNDAVMATLIGKRL